MEYLRKIDENSSADLLWNVPEQKQGALNVVGGNLQNFRIPIKIAEFLNTNYPIRTLNVILPDVLKNKLPPLDNLMFLSSTDSGSFADGDEIAKALNAADYNLLIGDFSKNSITAKAVASACRSSEKPLLITRDAVDLITEEQAEQMLMNDQVIVMASMAQMQKLLRVIYYPKMLLLSQSLIQVVEVLHKFTLSYPVGVITLQADQVLIAKNGSVNAVPLDKTGYSPILFWGGEAAAKIATLNLYNPKNFLNATVAALFAR